MKKIDEDNQFEIIPIVDLSVNIGSSRVNIDFNKTVKYTIKVCNNGPNNASGVNLSAVLPEGLVYLSATPSIGTYDPEDGIWLIGNLCIGENQTLIINALTNQTGLIDFPVNVSSIEEDSNLSNNFKNKTIKVLSADLTIDIEASQDLVDYGDILNWTVTIRNDGPDDASKLIVSFGELEDDLIYLNCSNPDFNQSSLKLDIPSLSVGEEISFVISTKVNSSNKEIILPTNVTAETYDPDESNNFDCDSVTVSSLCDLLITIIPDKDPTAVGETVNWIINVTNIGPDNASDVNVFNNIPEGLEYVIHESSKGEVVNVTDENGNIDLTWKVGDLENNESAFLIISTKTLEEGIVLNNATANSSTKDINESNNFDSSRIEVVPLNDDPDDGQNNDSDDPQDDFDDDYPLDDYNFPDDGGNNSRDELENDPHSKNKSLSSSVKKISSHINISSKKTGNPLILVILSLLTLFLVKVRKN